MKNQGLRNELITLCGLGALLLARRSRNVSWLLAASAGYLTTRKSFDSFRSQSVVITGGSRGLGLALALRLAEEGAHLTLLARDEAELERAKNQILEKIPHARVLTIACDITQKTALANAFSRVGSHFGGIDMLINNAGSILVGPYAQMERKDFEAQMELHFYSAMSAVNLSLPSLKRGKGKRIVNICSMGGRVAVPHMLPYDVSKFALAGYSQGLASELAEFDISVTTVYPTLMRTGSPIQAVFKGDHEKEFAWFATGDVLPGLSADPKAIANQIVESARQRRTELMPSTLAKGRMLAASLFPETTATFMKLLSALMPKGLSKVRKTGHESRALFDHSLWTQAMRQVSRRAELDYNQFPKDDAEFNMGLKH